VPVPATMGSPSLNSTTTSSKSKKVRKKHPHNSNSHKRSKLSDGLRDGVLLYLTCIGLGFLMNQYYLYHIDDQHDEDYDQNDQNEVENVKREYLENGFSFPWNYNLSISSYSFIEGTENWWILHNDISVCVMLSITFVLIRQKFIAWVTARSSSNNNNSDTTHVSKAKSTSALKRCQSFNMLRGSLYKETTGLSTTAADDTQAREAQENEQEEQNIFYYATTLFRLLYTFSSSMYAFFMFRDANFWPIYLWSSGLGSTQHCWNLSGSIYAGEAFGIVDRDYDSYNRYLKRYFRVQVSYQLQSLFFHCILLYQTMRSKEDTKNISESQQKKSKFFWIFIEHILGIFLLLGTFIFSSWRRLGAVAMFALDFSGVFIHFLQLFLFFPSSNNEEDQTKTKAMAKIIHRYLVIPIFMYCRLFILPFVIWYSAVFESRKWLEQMEHLFFRGWGDTIFYTFNGLLFTLIILQLFLFQRLLFVTRKISKNKMS